MKIRIFNVQFGESALITSENEGLLVDFGSDLNGVLKNTAQTIIQNRPDKISALVSHFHDDHINGFMENLLKKNVQFSTVYIPDIFRQSRQNVRITYMQLVLLKSIFESIAVRKKKNQIQVSLFDFLKLIMNSRSELRLLKRGDEFALNDVVFEVLWPCIPMMKLNKRTENRIVSYLEKIKILTPVAKDGDAVDIMEKAIDLGSTDIFGKKLASAFIEWEHNQRISDENIDDLERAFQEMQKQWNGIGSLTKSDEDMMKEIAQSMIKEGNRISIVFQDKEDGDYSRILMTGDITKSELNKIIQRKDLCKRGPILKRRYRLVKAPHHGTASHLVRVLPDSEMIYVSNGKTIHRNWGKIALEYGTYYHGNRKVKMWCTNQRCELYDLAQQNKGRACTDCEENCGKSYFDIDL